MCIRDRITPGCKIVDVDGVTEGAACTALLAKKYIDNDKPLFFANSDQFVEWDSNEFLYKMNETDSDGGIVSFRGIHPKWSFAKIDENGIVKSGKAEGMIIGTLMAKWLGKKYLGFVDSDNYFPGSVLEYIKEYAAGFSINNENNVLVRISWHSKPKVTDNKLFFQKWGRSSKNTNMVLNKLLTHYTGYETEIIKTGNAGEHALTMSLALQLDFASGYGIETNHFVNLFEKWGEVTEGEECNEKATTEVS